MTLCVLGSSAAPGSWPLETANVLLAAERRGRITVAERQQALATLKEPPIRVDAQTAAHAWGDALHLASSRGLTVYDAGYLEPALRLGLPLASPDRELREATAGCGVPLLGKRGGA